LEVQLVGFPYRACAHGHEKTYVYPDFGSELAEFLFGGVDPTTRKAGGLFSRGEACTGCGADLPVDAPTQEATFRIEPRVGEAPSFELVLRAPAVICGACGTAQIRRSTYGKSVNPLDPLLAAFEAADIRPA
jgi:hypothetical protein